MMQARRNHFFVFAATLLGAVVAGCSSDSGTSTPSTPVTAVFEAEPNDTAAAALELPIGRPAAGDVNTAGDVDCWKVDLQAGTVVSIVMCGTQRDYQTWYDSNNVPRLTLCDEDGTTKLAEQDPSGNFSDGWNFQRSDLDIAAYYVDRSGTYYINVTQDNQSQTGGAYVIQVNTRSDFGTITKETEDALSPNSNDTYTTAQGITPGTIYGFHNAGESDFYSFTITAPVNLRLEMFAFRNGAQLGGNYFDPEVWLYDTDGMTLLFDNNDDYYWDSGLDYLLVTPGTYFVEVNDDGDPQGPGAYLMRLGLTSTTNSVSESEPNDDPATGTTLAYGEWGTGDVAGTDVDYFNFTAAAGDQIRVYVYDANAGPFADDVYAQLLDSTDSSVPYENTYDHFYTLNAILPMAGTYSVAIQRDGGGPTTYAVRVEKIAGATPESEPNDTQVDQEPFTASRYCGGMSSSSDVDMYSFTAEKDHVYTFSCYASRWNWYLADDYAGFGSDVYPNLTLRDSTGTVVATASQVDGPPYISTETVLNPTATTNLTFVAPADGTFTLEVSDMYGSSGPESYYVIERH